MGATHTFPYYRPFTDENLWSFEACKRVPTCSCPLFDWYYLYSASLVLKRVRIRCCARRCCCKVFSGRRCISSAVLAHYSTGTTSLSRKGCRRYCCKVLSGKKECSCLCNGGRRVFTVGGAPLWYSNRSSSKRTTTEVYLLILAVIILLPSRYSEVPASQTWK